MPPGSYIFNQITSFLPQRQFRRFVQKYDDRLKKWSISPVNQLNYILFGQLDGSQSLRDLHSVISAHHLKCQRLGFGDKVPSLIMMSRANALRDYHMFEDLAYYMVGQAQKVCKGDEANPFYGRGSYYAFDSTTIDLCMKLYEWAYFRSTKSGIKVHTEIDIVSMIPTMFHITNAKVHDVNAMDLINYEPNACYIFDRGYFDLARLYRISQLHAFFIIREKRRTEYVVESTSENPDEENGVMADATVRFTSRGNKKNYPERIRRILYYVPELKRTFAYYTNNFFLKATDIALLYKYRWMVELFFKWIKQHLRVTTFWGCSENAVRIQVYVAIISYSLVCVMRQQMQLKQTPYEILRVLGSSLLSKDHIADLFAKEGVPEDDEDLQLTFDFGA